MCQTIESLFLSAGTQSVCQISSGDRGLCVLLQAVTGIKMPRQTAVSEGPLSSR